MKTQNIFAAAIVAIMLSAGTITAQTTQKENMQTPPPVDTGSLSTDYIGKGSVYQPTGTIDGRTAKDIKGSSAQTQNPQQAKTKSIYDQNGSTYQPNGNLDRSKDQVCCQTNSPK